MRSRRASALFSIVLVACCASEPRDEAPACSAGATAPEIVYEADLTGL